jgi:TolA-binding protein
MSHPGEEIEDQLWSAFATLDQPLAGERSDDELLDALFEAELEPSFDELEPEHGVSEEPRPVERAPAPRPRVTLLLTAALVLAASALLLSLAPTFGLDRRQGSQDPSGAARPPGSSAAMAAKTDEHIAWAHPGERHALGRDDCRRVGAKVSLCSPKAADLRVSEGSTDTNIGLELDSGELVIDGLASSAAIELRTAIARVSGGPGRLRVFLDEARGRLRVEVLAGQFTVESQAGERLTLDAGARVELDAERPQPEPEPEPEPEPASEAPPDEAPPHAAIDTPSKPASKAPSEPASATPPEPAGPDALLTAAQQALAAGERDQAIAHYHELVARHPDSRAAQASRVSLGRLLLGQGRAHDALTQFEAYLALDDAADLLEEARYGRIRSLRALGREADLRSAIAEFEARHPSSIHLSRIARWREELESP